MPSKYNLNYFHTSGRTHPVRMLFQFGEAEHKTNNVSESWDDIKGDILAKRFPVNGISTLQHNGTTIVQSIEIFSYVASQLNLCGASEEDKENINRVVDSLNQMFNKIGAIKFDNNLDDDEKNKAYAEYLGDTHSQELFKAIVLQLNNKGNHFYLGDKVSAADIFYIFAIQFITAIFPNALDDYPVLKDYREKIAAVDSIKTMN